MGVEFAVSLYIDLWQFSTFILICCPPSRYNESSHYLKIIRNSSFMSKIPVFRGHLEVQVVPDYQKRVLRAFP